LPDKRLESYGYLRDIDADSGRVTAIISTGDIARDGAIIDPAGWDFRNYDKNPVVLWMHDDSMPPFARTVERNAGEKKLTAVAEFDLDDPMGAEMFRKVKAGFVNATSVRWLPRKTEMMKVGKGKAEREVLVFREQELLEWSFVTIPADPKALIKRADGGDVDFTEFLPAPEPTPAPEPEPIPDPEPEPEPVGSRRASNAYSHVGKQVAVYIANRALRPKVDDLIARVLARETGKTEQRIQEELRHGR
jgi:HK97 family phage prohead protease